MMHGSLLEEMGGGAGKERCRKREQTRIDKGEHLTVQDLKEGRVAVQVKKWEQVAHDGLRRSQEETFESENKV